MSSFSDEEIIDACKKQKWYKIMCKLLSARGYNKQETFDINRYKQRISIVLTKLNSNNHSLIVIFDCPEYTNPNIKSNINKDIMAKVFIPFIKKASNSDGLLIVSQTQLGKNIKHIPEVLTLISSNKPKNKKIPGIVNIEMWLYCQLTINPLDHCLTPKHTLLTNNEQKQFLQKYVISSKDAHNKLPVISKSDAVIRWYNWPKNKIVKIERENGTTTYKYIID